MYLSANGSDGWWLVVAVSSRQSTSVNVQQNSGDQSDYWADNTDIERPVQLTVFSVRLGCELILAEGEAAKQRQARRRHQCCDTENALTPSQKAAKHFSLLAHQTRSRLCTVNALQ